MRCFDVYSTSSPIPTALGGCSAFPEAPADMMSERKNYRTAFALTSGLNGCPDVEDLLCLADQNQGMKSEIFKREPKKSNFL
jgi:hypothetical protein